MKRCLVLLLAIGIGISSCDAQFWKGLLFGIGQGLNQMTRSMQQNQYRNRQQSREKVEEKYQYEDDGFEWIRLSQYDSDKGFIIGAKNADGKVVIPLTRGYEDVRYYKGYFYVEKHSKEGVCNIHGAPLIPPTRGYENVCFLAEEGCVGYFSVTKDGKEGVCDVFGRQLIACTKESIIYDSDDKVFKYKKDGEWIKTTYYLASNGRGKNRTSSSSSSDGVPVFIPPVPEYGLGAPAYTGVDSPSETTGSQTDYKQRSRETLNRTVGEKCTSCKGTGKCSACNGTKIAHGFGLEYKCTVCDANGNCSVCLGTGKTSWNR